MDRRPGCGLPTPDSMSRTNNADSRASLRIAWVSVVKYGWNLSSGRESTLAVLGIIRRVGRGWMCPSTVNRDVLTQARSVFFFAVQSRGQRIAGRQERLSNRGAVLM